MQTRLIVHTIVYNDNREVLLTKRSDADPVLPGYWDIPGGTLEPGENPADGAARETLEESGLKIPKSDLFAFTSNIDPGKDTQFVRLIFLAKFTPGSTVALNPEEHSEYAFVKLDETSAFKLVDYLPRVFSELKAKSHAMFGF